MAEQNLDMRDNFSPKTKAKLAGRVAYRCCFPNCNRITIGPNNTFDEEFINLGEAAHIYAAAPGGPRYVPGMTTEARSSIQNGIWMCRHHARLIDADHYQFTPATLNQWKAVAEAETYRCLKDLEQEELPNPTTLICLDLDLIFEGIWKSAEDDDTTWTFVVKRYLFGNEQRLREYGSSKVENMLNYIIIESQDDGRLISGGFQWVINRENEYEVKVKVLPKTERVNPNHIGSDLATSPNGDILIENGDFKKISGKELAIQLIERNLSLPLGGWPGNVLLGSLFSMYYRQHHNDYLLLNRIVKIELIRLISIPPYQMDSNANKPELNFINRILEIDVKPEVEGIVPLFISLQWADNSYWSGILNVRLFDENKNTLNVPDFVKVLYEEKPRDKLKKLVSSIKNEEIKEKASDQVKYNFFNEILPLVMEESLSELEADIYPLFYGHILYRSINNNSFEYYTSYDVDMINIKININQVGLTMQLMGFKLGEYNAFDITENLHFFFKDYHYEVGSSRGNTWLKRLYHKELTKTDIKEISAQWIESIVKSINKNIEKITE